MAFRAPILLLLAALPSLSQTIVQPGAPGEANHTLTPAAALPTLRKPLEADIYFMQGMIHHHSQAVEMTELLRTRSHNKKLQSLGQKITISQTDEMKSMKQWLTDRGLPTTMQHQMDHSKMSAQDMKNMSMGMPLMPGMLTPEQMKALEKSSGPKFDRLFLTGMIQHHTGALIMVEDLFGTAGAGQDPLLFDFATDVDNTQSAEIRIMQNLLKEIK